MASTSNVRALESLTPMRLCYDRPMRTATLAIGLALLLAGCPDESNRVPTDADGAGPTGDGAVRDLHVIGDVPVEPVVPDPTELTYRLSEGIAALPLWTTPCTHKVRTTDLAHIKIEPV